jgi:LmbE family N-acetylglucosaminyl deacetylase
MQPRSLLAVFAHPDDEAFGSGGSLARYARSGVAVTLVCATRGEVGEISDLALATPETLPAVRERELRAAARAMGFDDVRFLDYRDSGMAGTADNNNPSAFVNIPAEQVIAQIVGIIRACKPQVVLTFDPSGGYGHPDHIAIHRHTVAAFHAAGDPARYPEQGAPWQPGRLLYTAIPRSAWREMRDQLAAQGVDTSSFDRLDATATGWPDDQIQFKLDVSSTVAAKWDALNAHQTQFGPDNFFRKMPEATAQQLLSREHFAQAWPEPEPGAVSDDLFSGL